MPHKKSPKIENSTKLTTERIDQTCDKIGADNSKKKWGSPTVRNDENTTVNEPLKTASTSSTEPKSASKKASNKAYRTQDLATDKVDGSVKKSVSKQLQNPAEKSVSKSTSTKRSPNCPKTASHGGQTQILTPPLPPSGREVFCSRTLNMKAIKAIGYDMDYTLVHYHADIWEARAWSHARAHLLEKGLPVQDLTFDPSLVTRGLVVDTDKGNVVKVNRFGYVKRAMHGSRALDFDEQRHSYSQEIIVLSDHRFVFLNTLFSLSEGCLFCQLVDLFDQGKITCVQGYPGLFRMVRDALDSTHMEGRLKAEIMADPGRFVCLDPETTLTLMDQKNAGKKLMLITNSEWEYTKAMMDYAVTPFLPDGMGWPDLFDAVIVSSRKPDFFLTRSPLFQVVGDEGLLKPWQGKLEPGKIFWGGDASKVENHLGVSGEEILFVGDHMWSDVQVSKSALKWRTALILRELEGDMAAMDRFRTDQEILDNLMSEKDDLEKRHTWIRLCLQRIRHHYGPKSGISKKSLEGELESIRDQIVALDEKISPLAAKSGELGNQMWGPLLKAGNDKSLLAKQVEAYADIYTSRVSNLLYATPFAYLRSKNVKFQP